MLLRNRKVDLYGFFFVKYVRLRKVVLCHRVCGLQIVCKISEV